MQTEFNKLSLEVQGKILIRNRCQDALVEPKDSIDKADFLIQVMQEICIDVPDNKESQSAWAMNKPRIEILVDMARDYIMSASCALQALNEQLKEDTRIDRGGVKDGKS